MSTSSPTYVIGAQLRAVQHALRWRRRVRLVVRAVWLALLVWCAGLAMLWLGIALPLPVLAAAAVATLLGGIGYAWWSQPSLTQLTHGLDRFYNLQAQTVTALEVAQRGPGNEIEERVVTEAAMWLGELRRYVARLPLVPWREAETLLAVALVALGLTVALGPPAPSLAQLVALPDLPPPAAPTATTPPEASDLPVSEENPPLAPQAQAAADALADGLSDNGATRPAADALRRGDLQDAASELRELADGADQLGAQARRDIAEGLREAADQLRADQPALAERLEQQADGLQQGGQAAEQALEDLARTVEELAEEQDQVAQGPDGQPDDNQGPNDGAQGDQPSAQEAQGDGQGVGPGAGSLPGGETRSTPGDAATPEGETVPLPSSAAQSGATTNANGPAGPSIEIQAGGTGSSSSSAGNGGSGVIQSAPDPLTIPPEYRDVVENYFTPAP